MRRLNTAATMEKLGIRSRETLRKLWKSGHLPAPVRDFDAGPNYWISTDIDAFIERQLDERRQREELRGAV